MQIGNKFRCYPNPQQEQILLQWIGCQRHIYNAKVSEDQYFRRFARKSLTHAGAFAPIDQQYAHFKSDLTPWLSEVPSQLLRNGAYLWVSAYAKFFNKLSQRPKKHQKHGAQSVWITSELFEFVKHVNEISGEITFTLFLGSKKFKFGELKFKAHRSFTTPASIHITVQAGRWTIGFTNEDDIPEPIERETMEWLSSFIESELSERTVGIDRGAVKKLALSNGKIMDMSASQKVEIVRLMKRKKHYQRQMANRVKGSNRRKKSKQHVARIDLKLADMRHDFAHQASHALVTNPQYLLFVFEALKVKNMSASAKGTAEAPGKNVRQKAGLNISILGAVWGKTLIFTRYKALRAGKLCIEVPPHYSSQECAECEHTDAGNRPDQATFVCLSCKHADNADNNAARVVAKRGVKLVLSGELIKKKKKKCVVKRKMVGEDSAEPVGVIQRTLEEILVSRHAGNGMAHRSLIREEAPAKHIKML